MNNTNIEMHAKNIRQAWVNVVNDITKNAETIPIIEDLHNAYLLINNCTSYDGSISINKFYGILAKELICEMCRKNIKIYDQIYLFRELIEQILKGYIRRIYTGDVINDIFFEIELAIFNTHLDKYFEKTLTSKIQDPEVKHGLIILKDIKDNTNLDNINDYSNISYDGIKAVIGNIFNPIYAKLYFNDDDILGTLILKYKYELPSDIDISVL